MKLLQIRYQNKNHITKNTAIAQPIRITEKKITWNGLLYHEPDDLRFLIAEIPVSTSIITAVSPSRTDIATLKPIGASLKKHTDTTKNTVPIINNAIKILSKFFILIPHFIFIIVVYTIYMIL